MKKWNWIFLLFFVTSQAFSQFKSQFQIGYVYDSNVFGSFAEIPDNYLTANLNVDNYIDWDYSSLDLSYEGGLSSYNSYPEEDNWTHNFNASYRVQVSRVSDNLDTAVSSLAVPVDSLETFVTLSGAILRTVPHSGDFGAYENFIASGLVNLRFPLGEVAVLRTAYGINYTGYDYITSLSNLENVGMANISFNLGRSFSLFLGASYGRKDYYGVDTTSIVVQKLIKMHSNGTYTHGKGKGKNNGNPIPGPTKTVKTYSLDSPSVSQLTYGAGLEWRWERWKADGDLFFRVNETGYARYVGYVAEFAGVSSLVYDDPYSYHGTTVKLAIAGDSLFWGVNASIGLDLLNKHYSGPAFDITQTIVVAAERHDNYADFSIKLRKKFPMSGVTSGLTVGLEYHHISNSSNDVYYQFTDDAGYFSIGLELF
jgi:hypothetical protein